MLTKSNFLLQKTSRIDNRQYSQFVYQAGLKFKKTQKKEAHRKRKMEKHARKKPFTLEDLKEYELSKQVTVPTSLTVPVINFPSGEMTGKTIELPADIFAAKVRVDLLHRYVVWHRANLRQGTSQTKSRGMVKGSTRKVYRQKGSGRARRGNIRTPVLRGGGRAFAKVPKDWSYPLPKKVRRLAFKSALSSKFSQNKIIIVDDMKYSPELRKASMNKSESELTSKDFKYTSPLIKHFKKNGWNNVLLVDDAEKREELLMSTRNTKWISLDQKNLVNAYDILKFDTVIIHQSAIPHLQQRSSVHARITPPQPKSEDNTVEQEN